ncbi:MAG: hypothetical protein Q9182_006421 [Xanthomendoza sp. 2 TL-2023]
MYPHLVIEPYQIYSLDGHYTSRIIHFTLYQGQATLANMGIPPDPPHTEADDYDEDEVSNFYDSDAGECFPEAERWSSEELDHSEDGDSSATEGNPEQHEQDCSRNPGRWELGIEAFQNCGCCKASETSLLLATADNPTTIEATANELEGIM